MDKQFVVVAYDISDDGRRRRMHRLLEGYGTPVQYSVFECWMSRQQRARLAQAAGRIIKGDLDQVRYYTLCERCLRRIEIEGRSPAVSLEEESIVV